MLHIAPAPAFDLILENLPADKSLSHRALIFALFCQKPCFVQNLLMGQDCLSTLNIAKALGLRAHKHALNTLKLTPPKQFLHFNEPSKPLNCRNSGTTMRLFSGLLSSSRGQKNHYVLVGDTSLSKRPMGRVIVPLQAMGAHIHARAQNLAPLSIVSAPLQGTQYISPIASAQVKSAILLATLNAKTPTTFSEPHLSRDHTERGLLVLGAPLKITPKSLHLEPLQKPLESFSWSIPTDPSSAFYFALAVALVPQSAVLLKNVLLNPTRIEAFKILEQMGLHVEFHLHTQEIEPAGTIYVEHRPLKALEIKDNIPFLIDELPALAVAMAVARGISVVKNAQELRVKESDRIATTLSNLAKMGIECQAHEDGFSIKGGCLKSPQEPLESFGDHRIALSFAIALLACGGSLKNTECMAVSFPNFQEILGRIAPIKDIYASENG
ncbi:3-phosphoshikimate 1-carboxyvinyltransferase [Helicobacter salomonis]|uniref:3-phosphoshikimate 1-carboxyvinyltransferase n=1 Tax=Helicobacter salomonis TaxID=56878 RepID=UPI000CF09772|nr:3-phosphoshikimate 1-carboxyvinyltransferase [Helicobacter salomonis]